MARALRLVRFGNWWMQKIPPLLFVIYIELLRGHASWQSSIAAMVVLVFCISCVAAFGHVVNDWCDIDDDARAGKPNTMRDVPVVRRAALTAALLVSPFVVLAFLPNAWPASIVLALNYLWPTLYSVPFVRLKERGILGVGSDALGSHITPTVFAFALTVIFVNEWPSILVFVAVLLWATVLGIKGILYHQVADRANDELAGVATYAASLDFRTLSTLLTRYNLLVELPVSVFLTAVVAASMPVGVVALALYVALESTKCALGFEFALGTDAQLRRRSVPFANEMFYTLWLPLAATLQLAIANIALWWLPIVHCVLFNEQIAVQLRDASAVFQGMRNR